METTEELAYLHEIKQLREEITRLKAYNIQLINIIRQLKK